VKRILVAITDSDPLRVVGFQSRLASAKDIELIPMPVMELVNPPAVDVVLFTDRPGSGLVEKLSTLKTMLSFKALVTGLDDNENHLCELLAHGAKGYVAETEAPDTLANAIRAVSQGLVWAPRSVVSKLIDQTTNSSRWSDRTARELTARQKEVLKMLVSGRSNKEIALPLGIEERTVKAHVAQLLRKLGAKNRVALSVRAIREPLLLES